MTISIRIMLGISAAALCFSLARVPAALAQDGMTQDIDFRNSLSRGDGVKKDTLPKDPARDPVKQDNRKRYGTAK